ncbi:hypothetical protein BDZ97DRAFT_1789154 [Flammula alnicola]|nr:hypothetical protein BDZ97DRAFT_1789154 [Flammula alnicola]
MPRTLETKRPLATVNNAESTASTAPSFIKYSNYFRVPTSHSMTVQMAYNYTGEPSQCTVMVQPAVVLTSPLNLIPMFTILTTLYCLPSPRWTRHLPSTAQSLDPTQYVITSSVDYPNGRAKNPRSCTRPYSAFEGPGLGIIDLQMRGTRVSEPCHYRLSPPS